MKRFLSIILLTLIIAVQFPVTTSAAIKTVNPRDINKYEENTEALSISQVSATIYIGETLSLKINGLIQTVTWKSDNKDVATVSKQGKVIGVKTGKANITASVRVDGIIKKLNCQVDVTSRIGSSEKTVLLFEDEQKEIELYGYNIKDNEFMFYNTDDESVIDIENVRYTNKLIITPKKIGVAKISVYAGKTPDSVNYNDTHEINIIVTDDKEWISPDQMICLMGDDYLETLYGDDYSKEFPEYNGYEITTKSVDNFFTYFNAEDLKEAGLL